MSISYRFSSYAFSAKGKNKLSSVQVSDKKLQVLNLCLVNTYQAPGRQG